MCMYIYIYINAYISIYVFMCILHNTCTYICALMYIDYMCTNIDTSQMTTHSCTCIYIYVQYIYMYTCIQHVYSG